jgi:hypothetical protein
MAPQSVGGYFSLATHSEGKAFTLEETINTPRGKVLLSTKIRERNDYGFLNETIWRRAKRDKAPRC